MIQIEKNVQEAIRNEMGVVGLESVVLAHGLPKSVALETAVDVERTVREEGALPVTWAVLDGRANAGLSHCEKQSIVQSPPPKTGPASLAALMGLGQSGATTAGATMVLSHSIGIRVVATGGIGGVHRHAPWDVSADLHFLATLPLVVVCSGAKSILDLPRTLELLETSGVTMIGYGTSEFPGFYSRGTGLDLRHRADSPREIADIWRAARLLQMPTTILVLNPPPADLAFPREIVEDAVIEVIRASDKQDLRGPDVTPAQLGRLQKRLGPRSIELNRALLIENARLAAKISLLVGSGR